MLCGNEDGATIFDYLSGRTEWGRMRCAEAGEFIYNENIQVHKVNTSLFTLDEITKLIDIIASQ